MFNSREYEWADINVVMAGRNVTGFRAVSYTSKQEKEALYAKGNKPHSIQRGNKSYEGSISLVQSEYEALKQAAGGDILDASIDLVVSYGNPTKGDTIVTDLLQGVEFTDDKTEWKQGDKFQEKELPFIFLDKKNL
jgi:hypothetical protein